MAADEKRDTPVPVKKGTAGPPRRVPTTATASSVSRKTPEELDERQKRMREVRRRGRQLGAGPAAAALAVKPAVPPTDADDEGEQ